MSPYLTKSKFVRCLDCPTKLFYATNPGYKSALEEDEFLQALARGGIQVGELARLYHPGGVHVETLDTEKALQQTNELLQRKNVTIYEPAVRYGHCLVWADVLEKKGGRLNLVEVKSKSWEPDESLTATFLS